MLSSHLSSLSVTGTAKTSNNEECVGDTFRRKVALRKKHDVFSLWRAQGEKKVVSMPKK